MEMDIKTKPSPYASGSTKWNILKSDLRRNKTIYLMLIPVLLFYLIFEYGPLYGIQIAFKNYAVTKGIWSSPWAGFRNFEDFFQSYYFWRLLKNTLLLSFYDILFGFPAPIILALLLNEVRLKFFKHAVQTVTYLPHFISLVVIVGMIVDFTARDGLINQLLALLGIPAIPFLIKPEWFRTLYVSSDIWQGVGWGSIIYLAAITNIDPTQYEAARIDGAGRWKQMLHVTIPGILPTVVILFILRVGGLMSVGAEKIILMYNPTIFDTADVISTFVYRKGVLEMSYSYSAAVGLFNSIINFSMLILANSLSRRLSENKLW